MLHRLHMLSDAAAGLLYAGAIGVAVGLIAAFLTEQFEASTRAAWLAFLIASLVFGYGLWRKHRPSRPAYLGRQPSSR
jgi:hypothetical protein